jgi:hypothetical protein
MVQRCEIEGDSFQPIPRQQRSSAHAGPALDAGFGTRPVLMFTVRASGNGWAAPTHATRANATTSRMPSLSRILHQPRC